MVPLDPTHSLEALSPTPLMAALSALLGVIVAAVVLNRDPDRAENRAFFNLIVLSVLANLNAAAVFFDPAPQVFQASRLRLVFGLGGLTMWALVMFARAFPLNRRAPRPLTYGLGALAVLQLVASVVWPDTEVTIWYSRFFFSSSSLLALYFMIDNYRMLKERIAKLGLLLVQGIIVGRYLMLAITLGNYRMGELPSHGMLVLDFILAPPVMAALLGAVLMRFQLLGLRFFLSRSLAYLVVSSGALFLYLSLLTGVSRYLRWLLKIDTTHLYFSPIVILLLLIAFHPIRLKVEQFLDRRIDRGYAKALEASARYFALTERLLERHRLLARVAQTIHEIVPESKVALLYAHPSPRLCTMDGMNEFLPPSSPFDVVAQPHSEGVEEMVQSPALEDWLRSMQHTLSGAVHRDALEGFARGAPSSLNSLQADLAIPLHGEGGCNGVLFLKATHLDDARVRLLAELAQHVGLQIENSRLYHQALEANEALQQSNRTLENTRLFLESLFQSVPVGIAVMDTEGRIVRWNRGMERITGITAQTAIDASAFSVLMPQLTLQAPQPEASKRLTVSPLEQRLRFPGARQDTIVHVRVSLYRDGKGGLGGTVLILTDVTEQVEMQEALEASKRLAALGQFAAAMAHEIRTPMTSIQMNVQILAGKVSLPPEDEEYFEIILTELNRLNRTVGEILDFARPMRLALSEVDLRDLAEEVTKATYFLFAERGVEVLVELPEGINVTVDAERMKQVLINLLDNASQAISEHRLGEPGGEPEVIRVRGGPGLSPEGLRGFQLEVVDTGCGIDAETLEHIFEPFYTTRAKGTGLGLAISKKIVEGHRGILTCESRKGEGSTFRVWLPGGKEALAKDVRDTDGSAPVDAFGTR